MTFGESISTCMGKYATFKGRASRSEYWWFILFGTLMSWGATLVGYTVNVEWGSDLVSGIVNLVFVLPSVAVATRRMHDIGKSGWWQLIFITIIGIVIYIVWCCRVGDSEPNKYGEPLTNSLLPEPST